VKLDFVGANAHRGEEPQEAIVSYFKGSPEDGGLAALWVVSRPVARD
jgi:hypothetical protein